MGAVEDVEELVKELGHVLAELICLRTFIHKLIVLALHITDEVLLAEEMEAHELDSPTLLILMLYLIDLVLHTAGAITYWSMKLTIASFCGNSWVVSIRVGLYISLAIE